MHHFQTAGDIGAGISVLIAWINVLPSTLAMIATVLGCIWYALMILDWFAKRKCDPCKKDED
jgi:hypothetical protein